MINRISIYHTSGGWRIWLLALISCYESHWFPTGQKRRKQTLMNSKEKDCVFVVEWLRICDGVVENQRPAQALFHIWRCLNMERSYKRQGWKMATWDSAWILTLERKWNIQGWTPKNASKLITFVEGRLNFSCKSSTAANVDLMESLLDNWLKNNHITLDKIYYLCSCLYFFYEF